MPKLKSMLWRLIYAVVFVVVLIFVLPLLFELVGLTVPAGTGPAVQLLKFAFAALIMLFVFFGPETPYPF